MPRIYKGSETILKLLIDVPSTSVIDKIKIALFTTDRSIAMEFYADSITLYGNIAYLNAPEWTFMEMQDGIINYIAQGESNSKPFIFERQSNYILKSSDGFEMSEIMNGYYTKEETDEKLEEEQDKLVSGKTIKTINGESVLGSGNIEVDVDLTGYATEQWVKQQGYVTDSDVNDYVGNEIGQVEERFNDYYTKVEVDEMLTDIEVDVDLTGYATEQYVNDAIANIDIPEGGSGGGSTIVELSGTNPTLEEFNLLYESASAGKPTYVKYNDGMFSIIADYDSITNRGLYHLYNSAFDVFMVFWYNQSNNSTVYSIKKQIFCSYGVSELVKSTKNDMKLHISNASINELPRYYEDYSKQFKAPISINRDKTISMILDGKLYFWDFTDESTNDGNGYHYPKVVDLVNISGGSGDLSDYYTKSEVDELVSNSGGGSGENKALYVDYAQSYSTWYIDTVLINDNTGEEIQESTTQVPVKDRTHNAEVYQQLLDGEGYSLMVEVLLRNEPIYNYLEYGIVDENYPDTTFTRAEKTYRTIYVPASVSKQDTIIEYEGYCSYSNTIGININVRVDGRINNNGTITQYLYNPADEFWNTSINKGVRIIQLGNDDWTNEYYLDVNLIPYDVPSVVIINGGFRELHFDPGVIGDLSDAYYWVLYQPNIIIKWDMNGNHTFQAIGGGEGGGGTILPTDSISCNSINANSAEFSYATFNAEIYLNGGQGFSPMVDTANGIETAYKTSRTMVNDIWVDNIHIGNRYDGNNRINFTTTNYNVPEDTTDSEKIVASIDAEGNFYEGETKLSDKYVLKSDYNALLARIEALENK